MSTKGERIGRELHREYLDLWRPEVDTTDVWKTEMDTTLHEELNEKSWDILEVVEHHSEVLIRCEGIFLGSLVIVVCLRCELLPLVSITNILLGESPLGAKLIPRLHIVIGKLDRLISASSGSIYIVTLELDISGDTCLDDETSEDRGNTNTIDRNCDCRIKERNRI